MFNLIRSGNRMGKSEGGGSKPPPPPPQDRIGLTVFSESDRKLISLMCRRQGLVEFLLEKESVFFIT